MKEEKFLCYASQSIDEADIAGVSDALKSAIITRGPKVDEFEKAVADYCGVQYAVAFSSGTAALMAAYHVVNLGPYDRIVTTPNTFVATVGAAVQRGVKPIFVDIDRETGNLDLNVLEENMHYRSSRGRTAIVPVHFSGIPVDMERIDRMITDPDTVVIEDACHAFGSSYSNGQKVGSCAWSQMTTFSFHPVKNLTCGEGGMVTTNDEVLYHRLRRFRNSGMEKGLQADPWYYEVQEITGNYNLTDFQAALGLSQLKRIDSFVAKRQELVVHYRKKLKGKKNVRLFTPEYDAHTAFHLFVVQIDFEACKTTRAEVMHQLLDRGIGTQVHYIPIYQHPALKESWEDRCPNMEKYYEEALSLPLYYDLTCDDVNRVVKELLSCTQAEEL